MELVFRSAIEAIGDLRAPGIMKLFFACIGLTALAAIIALTAGLSLVDTYIEPRLLEAGSVPDGFFAVIFKFLFWGMMISVFLTPIVVLFWSMMVFIASFFDEYIAEKIERFRYPQLAMGQSHPFWREFRHDLLFSLQILIANMVLLIPIFWPVWPIVFPLLNGYMLGRYFFRMAGGRHIGKKKADELAKQHKGKVLLAGLLIVIASGIPLLNLLVPFWGVAMMVHLYHLVDKPTPQEVLPPA